MDLRPLGVWERRRRKQGSPGIEVVREKFGGQQWGCQGLVHISLSPVPVFAWPLLTWEGKSRW